MKKQLYKISVYGEFEPYYIYAYTMCDAIFILKGKLIELDRPNEIVRVEYDDEITGETHAFNNINIKINYEEVL